MSDTEAPFKETADKVVSVFKTHIAIARALGYDDLRNVSAWANGVRQFPAQHCVTLERESKGELPVEMLRPGERWMRVKDKTWPHPQGRPLLDLAVTESEHG